MMLNRSQILVNHNQAVWPHLLPSPPPPPREDPSAVFRRLERKHTYRSYWKGKRSDQNRLKSRRYAKKKLNNNRFAPFAPRNTTSFIIRAKKSGGIASLTSPCPVTPAVIPTPIFSPSSEVLGDMAKEEFGVDGYGSMKGLIRLRCPGHEAREGGSSDVEEHVEVERRLDHDLSRFEMIYNPNSNNENLTLKVRLLLMERELDDLRRRVQCLETNGGKEASEIDDGGDVCSENSVRYGHNGGGGGD